MKDFISELLKWLRSVLSERDGTGSTTRVLMFVLVIAAIVWSSVLLHDAHARKITIEQFNNYLGSIGQYLTITAGPLYATNKIADCVNNRSNNNSQ
jgi:hypothetical protein